MQAKHLITIVVSLSIAASALSSVLSNAGVQETEKTVSFVACPIYRDVDAGRKSGCWLANDHATSIRYDVTDSPVKPIMGREILVEGVLTNAVDTCGGVTLKPVRVSVLTTSCPSFLLPAEGFPSRPFVLPKTVLTPTFVKREPLKPPFENKTWTIYFELNNDFLRYQHAEVILDDVTRHVLAEKPKHIILTAYAATAPATISGREIKESMDVAKARAAMVMEAFSRLGIDKKLVSVEVRGNPAIDTAEAMRGLPESSKRRVTIAIDW